MQASDFISALALLVAGGSLGLEVRRWFEAGPRLHISVMADAILIPDDDHRRKLVITVTNRGDAPTTITHMICFAQHPRWQFWRRKPLMTAVVNTTMQPIPFEIGINRTWMGRLDYDDKTLGYRAKGLLYVGVIASHVRRDFLVRVEPERAKVPQQQVGN